MAPERSAQRVLPRTSVVSTATLGLGLMILSVFSAGCIAPVEAPLSVANLNYPPEYDLRSVTPREGRLDVNPSCPVFRVEVGRIWDKNDSQLLFRWVANNDRANTRIVRGTDRSAADPGQGRPSFARVAPATDFASELRLAEDPGATAVGVLSLFITDAPDWQTADEDFDNAEQKALDLSGVIDDGSDGGPPAYSVVEVRWSVVISDRLEGCPQ